MQEGSAIRDNENWVQTFGAYRSRRYRHAAFRYRETDRHLARPTSRRALFGKLTQLPMEGKSVTGQRSNQLNYVPSCFSYG